LRAFGEGCASKPRSTWRFRRTFRSKLRKPPLEDVVRLDRARELTPSLRHDQTQKSQKGDENSEDFEKALVVVPREGDDERKEHAQ
jgi:hypothetical protein